MRKTIARTTVSDYLSKSEFPVDVDQIISYLRTKKLSTNKVTVYRIIDFMMKNGAISRVEFGEGKYRYEIAKEDHHHLICQNCGRVIDIEDKYMNKFEKEIKDKTGFLVKSHSLEFFGLCTNCQK